MAACDLSLTTKGWLKIASLYRLPGLYFLSLDFHGSTLTTTLNHHTPIATEGGGGCVLAVHISVISVNFLGYERRYVRGASRDTSTTTLILQHTPGVAH